MATGTDNVIVIGGGVIGIACAHYLSEAGFDVTVIDRSRIGAACSQSNCGFVCPSHVLPLTAPGAVLDGLKSLFNPRSAFRVRPQLRPALYRWMFEFARRCTHQQMIRAGHQLLPLLESSMDEFRALFSEGDLDAGWKEDGLLFVFQSEAGFDEFAETDRLLNETYGISAEAIDGDRLPTFEPALKSGLAGAFWYDDDASLKPDQLVSAWHARLNEAGVRFVEGCSLESVQTSEGRIASLETSNGRMTADHYVFATGAWSRQLTGILGCDIPVEPGKGYSVTMTRPAQCPAHAMLFPEHRIGITPFEDSYRIGSMMEFVGYDSSIPDSRIAQLRDSAVPYLETPHGEQLLETWYGWRPMTWDSLPIVGRVPDLGNGVLATGHNMLGLTLAPATGKLVAELLQQKPTHIDIAAYSPARF